MFKKWDIIVILLLIVLSFIPEIVLGIMMDKQYTETYAQITLDGKFYKTIPLSEHKGEDFINIKTKYGYNKIKVSDGSIGITDADCKDKICVKTGFISKPGQSIICLPHKLMIEVKTHYNKQNTDIIPAR